MVMLRVLVASRPEVIRLVGVLAEVRGPEIIWTRMPWIKIIPI